MADDDPLLDPDYRYSINRFTGDGAKIIWDLNFAGGFISRTHVKAYLENSDGTTSVLGFDWVSDGSVTIEPPVAMGQTFVFYRDTPKNEPLVDFEGGAPFTERNLDTLSKQAVFVGAETLDRFADVGDSSEEATITSLLALATANTAIETSETATENAGEAAAIATGAQITADQTAAGFQALSDTVEDLVGTDLTGLARLDTTQTYTERQTFSNGLEVSGSGVGTEIIPGGLYRIYSGGAWGTPYSFNDWDVLSNKPASFTPSPHTQDWSTITGKPLTFAPGAHTHAYADITGKPTTFPPSAHTQPWSTITGAPSFAPVIISTAAPSGGVDGDVWLRYVP